MTKETDVYNSCRVVLIDADDRVLLFEHLINGDPGSVWVPPGGGAEPGESFAEAARRELWEETGLRVDAVGPLLWVRTSHFPLERLANVVERYFLCRVEAHEIGEHLNIDEAERASVRDYRWWRLDEIAASDALFGPRELATLLLPIIAGRLPIEPIQIEPGG